MYQKFIITGEGVLRFGKVYQHRELLRRNEDCLHGGGLWQYDTERGAMLLYGRSFAYGAPSVECIAEVDWDSAGVNPCPLFFLPEWPYSERLQPVATGLW